MDTIEAAEFGFFKIFPELQLLRGICGPMFQPLLMTCTAVVLTSQSPQHSSPEYQAPPFLLLGNQTHTCIYTLVCTESMQVVPNILQAEVFHGRL